MICKNCHRDISTIPQGSKFCPLCGSTEYKNTSATTVRNQIPHGFIKDPDSGWYYISTQKIDPKNGACGECITWYDPDTGKYQQQFYPAKSIVQPVHHISETPATIKTGSKKPIIISIAASIVLFIIVLCILLIPSDSQEQDSTTTSPSSNIAETPVDDPVPVGGTNPVDEPIDDLSNKSSGGEFLYASFFIHPSDIYRIAEINELSTGYVVFSGDIVRNMYLEITEFTLYIDGEAQPFSASTLYCYPRRYVPSMDITYYSFEFDRDLSIADGFVYLELPKTATVWFEMVINGSNVRSTTLILAEDEFPSLLEDSSADPQLKFETRIMPVVGGSGTPPNVPYPLLSHPGDSEYFYVFSDDYIVLETNVTQPSDFMGNTFPTEYLYYLFSFDISGNVIEPIFTKHIFENDELAQISFDNLYRFSSFPAVTMIVGNVIYTMAHIEEMELMVGGSVTKERVLDFAASRPSGLYYVSKP